MHYFEGITNHPTWMNLGEIFPNKASRSVYETLMKSQHLNHPFNDPIKPLIKTVHFQTCRDPCSVKTAYHTQSLDSESDPWLLKTRYSVGYPSIFSLLMFGPVCPLQMDLEIEARILTEMGKRN